MSSRIAKFMRIDYSFKFPSFHEAEKEANRIREKVKREAERKSYAVQMLIGISDMDGKTKEEVQPHLHIMFYACPCETLMATMVHYINVFQKKHNMKSAATKHGCDTGYIPYIIKQSRKIRHYEHDPDDILKNFSIRKEVERIEAGSFRKKSYQN